MSPRKDRLRVVLDTNVLINFILSRTSNSAAARIVKLWFRERKLQLILSDEVIAEYYEILERVGADARKVEHLYELLSRVSIVTHVNLGSRYNISRDADDNVLLATAQAGNAEFLITNDYDLLDISARDKKRFRFAIVKPAEFLAEFEN